MEELRRELNTQLAQAMTQLIETVSESVETKHSGPDPNRLLSPREAAELLGVSKSQVRTIFRESDLPVLALPSSGTKNERTRLRVRYGALVDWIQKRENNVL